MGNPTRICWRRQMRTMLFGMGDAGDDGAIWTAVDAYLADHLIAKDEVLEAAFDGPDVDRVVWHGLVLRWVADALSSHARGRLPGPFRRVAG